jgi:hypothetical protein
LRYGLYSLAENRQPVDSSGGGEQSQEGCERTVLIMLAAYKTEVCKGSEQGIYMSETSGLQSELGTVSCLNWGME